MLRQVNPTCFSCQTRKPGLTLRLSLSPVRGFWPKRGSKLDILARHGARRRPGQMKEMRAGSHPLNQIFRLPPFPQLSDRKNSRNPGKFSACNFPLSSKAPLRRFWDAFETLLRRSRKRVFGPVDALCSLCAQKTTQTHSLHVFLLFAVPLLAGGVQWRFSQRSLQSAF